MNMRRAIVTMSLLVLVLMTAGPAAAPASEENEELGRILSKPEYNRWRNMVPEADYGGAGWDVQPPNWLERFFQWLRDWLNRESQADSGKERRETSSRKGWMPLGFSSQLFSLLGIVLLAAALIVLAFAVHSLWRGRRGEKSPPAKAAGAGIAQALRDGDALAFEKTAWERQADACFDGGDLRGAFRSLYLGLLSGLHEQGRIVFARNRTNWQYVRQFRGEGRARNDFAEMTDLFDRVWYGSVPALDAAGFRSVKKRVGTLLGGAPGHA